MPGAPHPDRYAMPAGRSQSEIVVKNSIFIGNVGPASSLQAAQDFILQVRGAYPDANHHAWAYRLASGPQGQIGSSDDGEPGGTAGRPMLAVLEGSGLVQIVAVGTRYWGGIKLGTGGLVRAYSDCVRQALLTLETRELTRHEVARIAIEYAQYGGLKYWLPRHGIRVLAEAFGARVELELAAPYDQVAPLGTYLRELTNGALNWADCQVGESYEIALPRTN